MKSPASLSLSLKYKLVYHEAPQGSKLRLKLDTMRGQVPVYAAQTKQLLNDSFSTGRIFNTG